MGFLMAQDMKLDELIEKNLKAIGQDNLAKIQTIRVTGKSIQKGVELAMTSLKKRPHSSRMELEFQETKTIFAYDRQSGWMIAPMTGSSDPIDMPADMFAVALKTDLVEPFGNWDNPFVNWKENGNKPELVGKEDLNGMPVYHIVLTFKDGTSANYFMDTNKYVILKTEVKYTLAGQVFDDESLYSDFREVEGILLPFKIESYNFGQASDKSIYEKIELNPSVDDAIFNKPGIDAK
jgi:hypothetical protein